jgi:hypothetical protein
MAGDGGYSVARACIAFFIVSDFLFADDIWATAAVATTLGAWGQTFDAVAAGVDVDDVDAHGKGGQFVEEEEGLQSRWMDGGCVLGGKAPRLRGSLYLNSSRSEL